VNDDVAAVVASLARAGIDLRQRPDGEWEVSVLREDAPAVSVASPTGAAENPTREHTA
jgi:hypothetical protein